MNRAVGIIPARYNSVRFPGKPLADINGKPMIQHVYKRAKQAKLLDVVVVATDDRRIEKAVIDFGGECYMTSKEHQSGTDRIVEVVKYWDSFDIVLNIQGDEPLIRPEMLDSLVRAMKEDDKLQVATLGTSLKDQDIINWNVVKVFVDKDNFAVKFWRNEIWLLARDWIATVYKHIGIYSYRRDFLLKFDKLPKSEREHTESLEQWRILDSNYKIKVVKTEFDTISVDTPEDLEKVEQKMKGEL